MFWLIISLLFIVAAFYLYRSEVEVKTLRSLKSSKRSARVGIVSDWNRKGVPYQSRFLSKILSERHDVHIFAYNEYMKDESDWGYRKLVFSKAIRPWKLIRWIKDEGLKVVFFPDRLEDKAVLKWCAVNGVATVMVINYETIKKEEFEHYRKFTRLMCPVKCTYDLLRKYGFRNISFIRWAIDTDMFKPAKLKIKLPIRLIHNAGFGGAQWRKNTLAVVDAFHAASLKDLDMNLIIKSQKPLDEYPERIREIIKRNKRIIVNEQDLEMKELIKLYRSCHISVLPSKWEGIGIPFIESLSLGLPVITVDAPPMNEWIVNNKNGLTAKVVRWEERKDPQLLIKGAIVDTFDLTKQILKLTKPKLIKKFGRNASRSTRGIKNKFRKETEKLIRSL